MERKALFPRSVRYLLAVAEQHSFTRAAEALYVSQPTLSQQIKQLEELLGVQLLDRTGRTVQLTAAGEIYLYHARRAMGELDAAKRAVHDLNDLSRGSIRLAMTPITDYLTMSLMDRFNAQYPGVAISTLEMPQDGIKGALIEDRIDVGIAFSSTLSAEESSEEIDSQILFIEPLSFTVGTGHPLSNNPGPLNKHTLEREPLVVFNTDYALRRHIDLYCRNHDIHPSIAMDATSLSVIVEIVRLGRLATILPSTISHSQSGLHSIAILPQLPHHAVSLIFRKTAYKSPACQAFAAMAADWTATRNEQHSPSRAV